MTIWNGRTAAWTIGLRPSLRNGPLAARMIDTGGL